MLRRLRPRPLSNQRGVTLVELMVVVAIIAIIAAIALTLYQNIQRKAKLAADQGTLAAIRSGIAIYYGQHNGNFPDPPVDGPPLLQAAAAWQCAGNGVNYDPVAGTVTLIINDVANCN